MKRLLIAVMIALIATAFVAIPAFAYGPDQGSYADVECGEPEVDNDGPQVGDTVLFYGTIDYDISAYNNEDYDDDSCGWHCKYEVGAYVKLDASGYYLVLDPDSNTAAEGGFDWSSGYITGATEYWDWNWPYYHPDENVSYSIDEPWNWSVPVTLDMAGDYTVEHGGDATAEYGHWVQYYKKVKVGCHWEWVPDGDPIFFADGDPAYDPCFTTPKVVTAALGGAAILNKPHAVLTIVLPDGRGLFFGSDGWDDPTDQEIVFSDGTWQVTIPVGTLIELDGKWHMLTTLNVDAQGGVTFQYGKSHADATDVGLSQPIEITKIG